MEPVETAKSNLTYDGDGDQVGDLPCERTTVDGLTVIYAVYELDDDDRRMIAAGANIKLGIWAEPISPVSLMVTEETRLEPRQPRFQPHT